MMRRPAYLLAALLLMSACSSNNGTGEPKLKYVEGRVVAATMNDMSIMVHPGDTVVISTEEADPFIIPGVLLGDAVKVGYSIDKAEKGVVRNAQSLEFLSHSPYYYIKGNWRSRVPIADSDPENPRYPGFMLRSDGTAKASNIPHYELVTWSLSDSTLTLVSVAETVKGRGKNAKVDRMEVTDIFTISDINDTTLVLSRGGRVVWDLRRR